MRETWVQSLSWEDPLEKGKATHSSVLGLPLWLAGKESNCNVGHLGLTLGLGGSPGEGKGHPLQHSGLENSMGSQRVGHDRVTPTFHNTNNMEILFLYVFALCLWWNVRIFCPLFSFFNNFYWSTVGYNVGFRYTVKWISYWVIFLIVEFWEFFIFLDISPSSNVWFPNISSQILACLFKISLTVFFNEQWILTLI